MITTAAIKLHNGLILTLPRPARHSDIIQQATLKMPETMLTLESAETWKCGFLRNDGMFLSREIAMTVADTAGQLRISALGETHLTTEHLW